MKGETSGNRCKVERILVDCDDDTVLLMVTRLGDGNVCHTGRADVLLSRLVTGSDRFCGFVRVLQVRRKVRERR